MFGTDISIELASSWKDNEIEIQEEQKAINDNEDAPDDTPEDVPEDEPKEGTENEGSEDA